MRGIVFIAMSLIFGVAAYAGTAHNVRFAQGAQVMVWQDGQAIGHGAEVLVAASGKNAAPSVPGSGQLIPLSDLKASADGQVRLKIASNAGFVIRALDHAQADQFDVEIVGIGRNAVLAPQSSELSPGLIFHRSGKTAQQPGRPESQAIELIIYWAHDNPPAFEVVALHSAA